MDVHVGTGSYIAGTCDSDVTLVVSAHSNARWLRRRTSDRPMALRRAVGELGDHDIDIQPLAAGQLFKLTVLLTSSGRIC